MDWIDLAQDRTKLRALVDLMNIIFPKNAENFLTSWETVSFSRRIQLHSVSAFHTKHDLYCTFF